MWSSPAWLIAIGGTPADIILFVVLLGVFGALRFILSHINELKAEAIKRHDELKAETIKHHDELKVRVKMLSHQYKQVDKLGLVLSHILYEETGRQTVKLHHSGEHEIYNPILDHAKKNTEE